MKRIFVILALLCGYSAFAQSVTTYTGTIKDLTGILGNPGATVTSGRITWTLNPPSESAIPGTGAFTNSTISCLINSGGHPVSVIDGTSACQITNNTALTPTGTSYKMCIQPYNVTPGSCIVTYASGGTVDISTVVPTPATQPSYGFATVPVPVNQGGTGANTAADAWANLDPSGILYPNQCGYAVPPSWCAGSDMGAWINAALAAPVKNQAHGRVVHVSGGEWAITTSFTIPGSTILECDYSPGYTSSNTTGLARGATTLVWSGTGTMVNLTGQGSGMVGCLLQGPGAGTLSTGIATSSWQHGIIVDTNVGNFGTAFFIGSNTYIDTFRNINFHDGTTLLGGITSDSANGENLFFEGGIFSNKPNAFSTTCIDLEQPLNVNFQSASFDQCGITMNATGVLANFTSAHFENPNGATALPFITVGSSCANCTLNLTGGDVLEDFASARTSFIEVNSTTAQNVVSIGGGTYQPAEGFVTLVHASNATGGWCFVSGINRGHSPLNVDEPLCGGTWAHATGIMASTGTGYRVVMQTAPTLIGPVQVTGDLTATGTVVAGTTIPLPPSSPCGTAYTWSANVKDITPQMCGAISDAQIVTDGTISGGALSTLNSAAGSFTASTCAAGKVISIQGAGGTAGSQQPLVTTCTYVGPARVTLATPASQAVTDMGVIWGTDNFTAFSNWVAALPGKHGYIPYGNYLINIAQSTQTLNLASNENITMDKAGALYFVGAKVGSLYGALFTIPINFQNIVLDGFHIVGEWQNQTAVTGIRQGYGDGTAILVTVNDSVSVGQNLTISNPLFTNLLGMGVKEMNTNDTNVVVKNGTFLNSADTALNVNSGVTTIEDNLCQNTSAGGGGCIESSGYKSHYKNNTSIYPGMSYAMQFGGVTTGAPYVGSEVTGNKIYNPLTVGGCFSIGDGFTYGTVTNNFCTGLTGTQIGIVHVYSSHVLTGNVTFINNVMIGATGATTEAFFLANVAGDFLVGNTGTATFGLSLSNATGISGRSNIWNGSFRDVSLASSSSASLVDTVVNGVYSLAGGGGASTFSADTTLTNTTGVIYAGTPYLSLGGGTLTGDLSGTTAGFSGAVTAATASPCNVNTTQVATTAFVQTCFLPLTGGKTISNDFTMNAKMTFNAGSGAQIVVSNGTAWSLTGNSTSLKWTSNGTPLAFVYVTNPNTDWVGIQTVSPTSALTVNGAISNGVTTATNSDNRGHITLVAGTGTYTFTQGPGVAGVWTTAPVCTIQDDTTPANLATSTKAVTATALTITGSVGTTDTYSYICWPGN